MKNKRRNKKSPLMYGGAETIKSKRDAVSLWSEASEEHYRRMAEYFGFSGRRLSSFRNEDNLFGFGL